MGLILVLNNSADDYFYNILNSIGSSVSFQGAFEIFLWELLGLGQKFKKYTLRNLWTLPYFKSLKNRFATIFDISNPFSDSNSQL